MTNAKPSGVRLPRDAVMPDYAVGGLFGLVASFARFLDGGAWQFDKLPAEPAGAAPSVLVFVLIDGLGDAFLRAHGAGSTLLAHRKRRLTTVFPSTTAAAVTTTLTGLAPVSHGLTGWFIRDQRFGGVLAPLPLCMRDGTALCPPVPLRRLFPYRNLFAQRSRASVMVSPRGIAWSPFSQRHSRGAQILPYHRLNDMRDTIVAATASLGRAGGGYVHAYYPVFDSLSHDFGSHSEQAIKAFWRIDAAFAQLLDDLAGSGVDVVVSADHGFIDSPDDQFVRLDEHPTALSMLAAPLWGERRAAFCELRDGAEDEFQGFVSEVLQDRAVLVRSSELVAQGLFGPGPQHACLRERVGSHALLMEPGWTIWDPRPGEHIHAMRGVHGGLSPDEMWVPLIHARC